jgi:RNA polymerase sigma-70 factor (ECF subfamily)
VPDWNEIVSSNAANVLNSAYRVLGNLADAEDVSQEVFTEAFRKWNAFPEQQWAGILRRMSVCRSIDLLRVKKTSLPLTLEVDDGTTDCPVESAIGQELEQRLRLAVSKLPDRESQVFCLSCFEQQSNQEIAQALGIDRTAVATALSKARSKLKVVFREITTGELK